MAYQNMLIAFRTYLESQGYIWVEIWALWLDYQGWRYK